LKLFTPEDIRKYFYASCFLAIICLIMALVAIGESGYGNTIEQSITGHGDLYTRHDSAHASDLASTVNSTVVYEEKRIWDVPDSPETFASSFIVSGASARGGFRNQYVVKSSGAGYKHVYRATQITGEFSGSGVVSLSIGEDGAESLDSLILMDSRNGNATFQGRIYSSQNGKPVTAEEMDAVGKLMIRSYLNISQPLIGPDNWLGFCESLNRLIDPAVAPGIYVAPDGYELDEKGNLVRQNRTG
jgi:hypothetical protein